MALPPDLPTQVEVVDRHDFGIRFGKERTCLASHGRGSSGGGVVRRSMVHYNTSDKVDRHVGAPKSALR